jgi:hypothetical protein
MKLPSRLTRKRQNGSAPTRRATPTAPATTEHELTVDLEQRRDQLVARVAELQWDLGGLERIVRLEQTGTAGSCTACGAPHSTGATFCWQCGQPLLQQVPSDAILKR